MTSEVQEAVQDLWVNLCIVMRDGCCWREGEASVYEGLGGRRGGRWGPEGRSCGFVD